jgi:hypothetical protein
MLEHTERSQLGTRVGSSPSRSVALGELHLPTVAERVQSIPKQLPFVA